MRRAQDIGGEAKFSFSALADVQGSTLRYPGIEVDDALEISEQAEIWALGGCLVVE